MIILIFIMFIFIQEHYKIILNQQNKIKRQKKSPATCYSLLTDTIAVTVLNFCVRDGYRCVHRAIVTRLFFERLIFQN